jgi:E3 ubiquitin-protein ligase UBR2
VVESETSSISASLAEQTEKDERAKLAAKRRAQILMQMQNAQKNFMTSNAGLFEEVNMDDKNSNANMDWQAAAGESVSEADTFVACMGENRKPMRVEDMQQTCILCSENSVINKVGASMVYPAFIQKSSVLSRYQQTNEIGQLQYLETSIHPSPHTSTCGHVLHESCWKNYFDNEVTKESRRLQRTRTPVSFDIEKNEFLCPLCRLLCNTVLPIIPQIMQLNEHIEASTQQGDFQLWLNMMTEYSHSLKIAFAHVEQIFDDAAAVSNVLNAVFEKQECLQKLKKHITSTESASDKIIEEGEEDVILSKGSQNNILKFIFSMKKVDLYGDAPQEIEEHLITWMSCAYTIESVEMYLRATEKPLKGGLSLRYTACLSGLIRLCSVLGTLDFSATCPSTKEMKNQLIFHLRDLCDTIFGNKIKSSIFDWDIFGMLISLIFTTRCVLFGSDKHSIANGGCLEYAATNAMFLVNMLKVILIFDPSTMPQNATDLVEMDVDEQPSTSTESASALLSLYRNFNIYQNDENHANIDAVTTSTLVREIKAKCETYLRSCCLLFNFMTDVELPDEMSKVEECRFELMCEYLGLSSDIEAYFKNASYVKFMQELAEHPDIKKYRENMITKATDEIIPIISTVPPVRQLVALPEDYSDLINSVSLFKCPNNDKEDSRNPTMCLICGEILCSQTYCCQKELDKTMVGACTYHIHTCGAGVGMFLRIRDAEILLLSMNKGCFISAPYLDEYGETDQGLRRGNPLYLCKDSYKKVHLTWLNHGIHEEIARKNESQNNLYPTQWHHF